MCVSASRVCGPVSAMFRYVESEYVLIILGFDSNFCCQRCFSFFSSKEHFGLFVLFVFARKKVVLAQVGIGSQSHFRKLTARGLWRRGEYAAVQ